MHRPSVSPFELTPAVAGKGAGAAAPSNPGSQGAAVLPCQPVVAEPESQEGPCRDEHAEDPQDAVDHADGNIVYREQGPPPSDDRCTGDKDEKDPRRNVHSATSSRPDGERTPELYAASDRGWRRTDLIACAAATRRDPGPADHVADSFVHVTVRLLKPCCRLTFIPG